MSTPNQLDEVRPPNDAGEAPVFAILFTIGLCHLLNDIIGGLVPALYPLFKKSYSLTFSQIGLITLTYQIASSLLQPLVGLYTDRRPRPFSLMAGMTVTLGGLIWLSRASSFHALVLSATAVGAGSAVFHPEASRVARLASGGQHGLAQSIFQVGGNFGFSLGPLLAAFIVIGRGQRSIAWFSLDALVAMVLLFIIGTWYKRTTLHRMKVQVATTNVSSPLPPRKVAFSLAILLTLIFSKYIYMSSITSYYTFYLISKFHLPVQSAQIRLFTFLASTGAGILIGGPRRPLRPQIRHLGFDHRGAPVHLASALCQSVLDRHPYRFDRVDPVFGVFGDSGLRAGVDSREGWDDLRVVFWLRLWRGRGGCRHAGKSRR